MNEQMRILSAMLDRSQWNTSQEILDKQTRHFHSLITHACQTVPFYQKKYSTLFTTHGSNIQEYPILTREMIQAAGEDFISQAIPAAHGQHYPDVTSGSTGKSR